jgi:UDP-3-O-[3-hydroxymyristoyl] N-acetylglucosamine deacetylase
LGYTLIGEYNAIAGSHHLNHLLTKKLLEDVQNYEIVDLDEAEEESKVFQLAYAYSK